MVQNTSEIFGLELLAARLVTFENRIRWRGAPIAIFVDNNAALGAILKGDASNVAISLAILMFWEAVNKYGIRIWLERAPSAANPADLPSRGPFKFPDSGLLVPQETWVEMGENLICFRERNARRDENAPKILRPRLVTPPRSPSGA